MTTPNNSEPITERRTSFRISPPAELVREAAVWFRSAVEDRTLPLAALGRPALVSRNGNGPVTLENTSGVGLVLRVSNTFLPAPGIWRGDFLYVYLKLASPLPGKYATVPLFLGAAVVNRATGRSDTRLHCHSLQRGVPDTAKKSFTLLGIERAGVKELTVWGDEILRMGRGILPPISPGLNLEYLLEEIEHLAINPRPVQEPTA